MCPSNIINEINNYELLINENEINEGFIFIYFF